MEQTFNVQAGTDRFRLGSSTLDAFKQELLANDPELKSIRDNNGQGTPSMQLFGNALQGYIKNKGIKLLNPNDVDLSGSMMALEQLENNADIFNYVTGQKQVVYEPGSLSAPGGPKVQSGVAPEQPIIQTPRVLAPTPTNTQPTQQPNVQPPNVPNVALQPGATGPEVKKLQDYLVSIGLMSAQDLATGPGIYGPKTTAAVLALQQRLGVDNSSGPGYFGPKTLAALMQGGGTPVASQNAPGQAIATQSTGNPIQDALNTAKQVQNSLNTLASKVGAGTDVSTLPQNVDISQIGAPGATTAPENQNLSSILGSLGIQSSPQSSITDIVKDLSTALGIDDVNAEMKTLDEKYADEIADINENPWISEALRSKKVSSAEGKYEAKKKAYIERLSQRSDLVGKAITLYNAERQNQQQLALKMLDARIDEEAGGTTDIKEYNLAKSQGYTGSFLDWQKQSANLKATASGSGGLTAGQINTTVNSIASAFDNEPIVKEYNTIKAYTDTFNSLGTSAPDDQARIYAFAKVMDPNSVVRESEYKTVQDYAQALVKTAGINLARIFTSTGTLTPEARAAMSTTLQTRLKAQEGLYNNISSEYQRQINDAYSGQPRTITNYSAPTTQTSAKGSMNDSTFVANTLNRQGIKYQDALNQIPKGKVGVIDNATGRIGSILPSEFNASLYTRL